MDALNTTQSIIISCTAVIVVFLLLLSFPKSQLSSFLQKLVGQFLLAFSYVIYLLCGLCIVFSLIALVLTPGLPDEIVPILGSLTTFAIGFMVKGQGARLIETEKEVS